MLIQVDAGAGNLAARPGGGLPEPEGVTAAVVDSVDTAVQPNDRLTEDGRRAVKIGAYRCILPWLNVKICGEVDTPDRRSGYLISRPGSIRDTGRITAEHPRRRRCFVDVGDCPSVELHVIILGERQYGYAAGTVFLQIPDNARISCRFYGRTARHASGVI